MNSYIIVAGDSWACGEYSSTGELTHGGLRQYLDEDGRQTLCFGYPGVGSLTAYDFLFNFIRHNLDKMTFEKILFFQSDWVRDIRSYQWATDEQLEVFQKGYVHTRDWYMSSLYYRLHDIYQNFGIPVVIVGGQGDTFWLNRFEHEYPGVTIGCQSFTNLIINNESRTNRPAHSVFKYGGTASKFLTQKQFEVILQQIKLNSNSTDLQQLITDMEIAKTRDDIFNTNRGIFLDNKHPDREAHKKLYHYLLDKNLL